MFQEIEEAKIQGHYKEYMKKLSKVDLLILDEFLFTTISECEQNDLFEVILSRTDKKSTIYCSEGAIVYKARNGKEAMGHSLMPF